MRVIIHASTDSPMRDKEQIIEDVGDVHVPRHFGPGASLYIRRPRELEYYLVELIKGDRITIEV